MVSKYKEVLSTDELRIRYAGGDSYIRTKDNDVKALAVKTELNPDAPEIIIVGKGKIKEKNAKLFYASKKTVPLFIKQKVNQWKFFGNYKAENYFEDLETIRKYMEHRKIDEIAGILFLKSMDEFEIEPKKNFRNNPAKKKEVELKAIKIVSEFYKNKGFLIIDRQKENLGYDLLVKKRKNMYKIEVKGTSKDEQRFFLSRNERKRSIDPHWRLAIVKNALNSPKLEIFTPEEMEEKFNFSAMSWECTLK